MDTDTREDVLAFARDEVKYPRNTVVWKLCRALIEMEAELQRLRRPPAFNSNTVHLPTGQTLEVTRTVESVVRDHIQQVMVNVAGNKSHAARILDIDRRSLYRWLKRMESPPG